MILCLRHSDIFTSWKWYWNLRFQWYYIRHKTGQSPISLGFNRISLRSNITRRKANITEKSTCYCKCFFLGGRWWIRTTEGEASRFTVCPLWPLGKSPILNFTLKTLELVDEQTLSSKVFRACITDATHFASKNITLWCFLNDAHPHRVRVRSQTR